MGMSEEDFDQVIDVNLKGTFNMMRFVSRQMLRQRSGRMISMASGCGDRRKCRTGKLCGIQSRDYWYDQKRGKRACIPRHHSERSCAGIY